MKKKGLGAWQLTMMALGSVIGGSFFLGSAVAINAAGPSILLGFIFGGALVYFILFAISEMTVANPSYGSFRTFAAEAFGKGTGFVVGWVYWTGMTLAMSSEATAVSILVKAWFPNVPTAALGSIIIVAVTLLNLLGASKLDRTAFTQVQIRREIVHDLRQQTAEIDGIRRREFVSLCFSLCAKFRVAEYAFDGGLRVVKIPFYAANVHILAFLRHHLQPLCAAYAAMRVEHLYGSARHIAKTGECGLARITRGGHENIDFFIFSGSLQ